MGNLNMKQNLIRNFEKSETMHSKNSNNNHEIQFQTNPYLNHENWFPITPKRELN